MKKLNCFLIISLIAYLVLFTSCDENGELVTPGQGDSLSSDTVAKGLKEALRVGTDSTVDVVAQINGYYEDEAIKLLLPPEGREVVGKLQNTATGREAYNAILKPIADDVVLSLNRSAEDAAPESRDILKNAIANMSVQDAYNILHGEDSAATHYMRVNTYDSLVGVYRPIVENSLNKPLVGGQSANQYWDTFVQEYNGILENPVYATLSGLDPIENEELGGYATREALNGLFYKVKQEEKQIRQNPLKRVTDILEKVFSELDN